MASYRETVIKDGPSAYWRLGEPGFVASVFSAEVGPDGDLDGVPGSDVPGALVRSADTCFNFNGTNEALTVSDDPALDLGDSFTVELWLKRERTAATETLIAKGPDTSDAYYIYLDTDDKVRLWRIGAPSGDVLVSTIAITDTNWHHVVFTKDGATASCYIDGADRSGAFQNKTFVDNTGTLNIAQESSGVYNFQGSLDEIALYQYALTPGQVAAHYEAGTVEGDMADLIVQVYFDNFEGVNITEYVKSFEIRRGRSYELDRFEAGTLAMTLLNLDSRFDPSNTDSPYYPYVIPLRRVKISADWDGQRYPIYTGYIDRWPPTWTAAGVYSEVRVTAVDALGLLGSMRFPAADYLNNFGQWNNLTETWTFDGATLLPDYCRLVYAYITTAFSTPAVDLTVLYRNSDPDDAGGRTVTDGNTNGGAAFISSSTINFTADDVGRFVTGSADIPDNTYIVSISSSSSAVISQNCTGSSGSQTFTLSPYKVRTGTISIPEWCGVGAVVDMTFQEGDIGCSHIYDVDTTAAVAGECDIRGQYEMFVQALSGDMAAAMLDGVNWAAEDRNLDTGLSEIVPSTPEFQTVLPYLQSIADGELGQLFVDTRGRVTFHQRDTRFSSPYDTSQATFGDGGGAELPYTDLVPDYDLERIYNEVTVTRTVNNATTHTASDSTSQSKYLYRPMSLTPPLADDADAASMATYLLSILKDPALRFHELKVQPQADAANLWPQVLGLDIPSRITVKARPPGGTLITQDCHIEQISHQGTPASWATTWQLSPVVTAPGY